MTLLDLTNNIFQDREIFFYGLSLTVIDKVKRLGSELNSLIAHSDEFFKDKLNIFLEKGLRLDETEEIFLLLPYHFPKHFLVNEFFQLTLAHTRESI